METQQTEQQTQVLGQASTLAGAPYIEAHGLCLGNKIRTAYQDIDFCMEGGRAHAILAENRAGKTELLLTLAGHMLPTAGTCTVAGIDVRHLNNLYKLRKKTGMGFFENVNDVQKVLPVRTVTSAELGLYGRKSNKKATLAYLEEWGLADVADACIDDLDRRTYDRLGIALGMVGDPELLVVDDIETDLTEHQTVTLIELLKDLARTRGITVVCGMTDYDLARNFDDVACITDDARAQRDAVEGKLAAARLQEVA